MIDTNERVERKRLDYHLEGHTRLPRLSSHLGWPYHGQEGKDDEGLGKSSHRLSSPSVWQAQTESEKPMTPIEQTDLLTAQLMNVEALFEIATESPDANIVRRAIAALQATPGGRQFLMHNPLAD